MERVLRIDSGGKQVSATKGRGDIQRLGQAALFRLGDVAEVPTPMASGRVVGTTAIDALLALQGVEDPLQSRRKAVKRGHSMLDILERLRADLLVGKVDQGQLQRLSTLLQEYRGRSEPGLEGLLDDIELRTRVELAKLGHYPQ